MELKYDHIIKEYGQLTEKLSQTTNPADLAKLGKRQSELLPIVEKIHHLEKTRKEIAEHEKLIADKSELAEMAASELPCSMTKQKNSWKISVFFCCRETLTMTKIS
jgi:protein subunit release factor A